MTTSTNRANRTTRTSTRSRKPVFELVAPTIDELHARCSTEGLFGGNTFFLGGGKANYQFQDLDTLVAAALAEADKPTFKLPEVRITKNHHYEINIGVLRQLDPMAFPVPPMFRFVRAAAPVAKVSDERRLAHDLANVMIDGLFEQPVHQFFSGDFKTLVDDKHLLAPEYHEIADSLRDQLEPAQEQVIQALPLVMTELRKRNPDASTGQLYQAALQLIGQQLAPILSTIQLWTTGFRQSLDPKLTNALRLVRAMVESNLFLVLTGNLKLDQIKDSGDIKQQIPTINVSVGDVVLPVLIGAFDSGPAVIPMATGALGPRGGHLAFVPWNLIKVLPLIVAIYMHETGHLLQSVIKDFMATYAKLIADTIKGIVFDEEFVMIGTQKIPAADFWTMVFIGQFPEINADDWGIRTCGPAAFIREFAMYVSAMTEVSVGSMDGVDHVLRMGSSYKLVQTKDGKIMIKLEPHPQDGPRIGEVQADFADQMGYPAEAAYAKAFAASESGTPTPTRITWVGKMPEPEGDDDQGLLARPANRSRQQPKAAPKTGKTGSTTRKPKADTKPTKPQQPKLPTISASVADYAKAAKRLAAVFFDTKTACLNGMSLRQLSCLTPKMHVEKVEPLKALLKKGVKTLPKDGQHYFFHTIGSAAIEALFEMVKAGADPKEAREQICEAAMGMMLELLPKWEADVKRLDIYKLTEADVQPKAKAKVKKTS